MSRLDRTIITTAALTFGLAASACSTSGHVWDPTDLMPESVFGSKDKLQGERKLVFPNGVPGVPEGVPEDLLKGHQQASADAETTPAPAQTAVPPQPTPNATPPARPKPKPQTASAPAQPQRTATPAAPPPPIQRSAPPADDHWPDPSQTALPAPKSSTY